MAKSFKEFLGLPTVRVGGLDSMHPIADLGDTPPKGQGSRASRATGLQANYSSQAPGTMRPFLKAQKKKTVKKEKWSKKYKDSIDCSNPKGFSQKAHCQGKKEETELENYLNKIIEDNPRIPRKKGQKANSKKHSDLYTDENPKGTIHGLKFANVKDAQDSVKKIENSGKKHAHKIQAAVAMEQRAREMGKTKEANVYRTYIEKMKKITKEKQND